jgi:hypothetical protein
MGGKNHQPCRSYLLNSTMMSRAMSLAFISVELANVALEDVIIAELGAGQGDHGPIVSHLNQSVRHLNDMDNALLQLTEQMRKESFRDLPSLATTDLRLFGQQAKSEDLHTSKDDWMVAEETMRKHGFWGMAEVFEKQIKHLVSLTGDLAVRVQECSDSNNASGMHVELEENGKFNFKPEFAKLYTAWSSFQQLFLASSLISTELWYRFNGFGSLLSDQKTIRAAA